MISAVKLAAQQTLPADETFVVKFISTDKITLVQEFTHDRDLLIEAAEDLFVEGGQTALIDAVNFSAQYFTEGGKSGIEPLRALILITDGDDRESISKTDATVKLLKENGVSVYSIGIGEGKIAPRLLEKLARETGGRVFLPRTTAELSAAVGEIYRLLRGERTNK
jgi:Ca-activated chloride channel family protein